MSKRVDRFEERRFVALSGHEPMYAAISDLQGEADDVCSV